MADQDLALLEQVTYIHFYEKEGDYILGVILRYTEEIR